MHGSAHIAFFFFDFNDEKKQNAHALLVSLLHQLSDKDDAFLDILHGYHKRNLSPPGESELTQCLEDMVRVSKVPVFLVVDALDESPNTLGVPSKRYNVLQLIKGLMQWNAPNLRLCVTSRREDDIESTLSPFKSTSTHISLDGNDKQKLDIDEYIKSTVDSDAYSKLGWTDDDKRLVIKTLSNKADGM